MERGDKTTRFLREAEGIPEIPEAYLLLRKLKMWGRGGTLPLPFEGGYLDQPTWIMLALEACMKVEAEFEAAKDAPAKFNNRNPVTQDD